MNVNCNRDPLTCRCYYHQGHIEEPPKPIELYGFGGKDPRPCSSRALGIATAMLALIEAEAQLQKAVAHVPGYIAQHSRKDYYAAEAEVWFRAADALEEALCAS